MYRFLALSLVFLLAFTPNDARKANEAYERADYALATELYKQALQSDPDNPKLHFNLGNSLAKMGRGDEAVQAYEHFKSLTDDPRERAMADYNIGNMLSEARQLEMAAEYYREALRNNPDDIDTKHNYELALRQQQEQQQQQQNQDQDQEQDQDQNQDQQDQDQDQDQQDQNQQDQNQQQQDPGDSEQDQQEQESQMSLAEAESILDALEQRERELLRDRKKDSHEERSNNERDW